MKPVNIQHTYIISILVLVIVIVLAGTSRALGSARAAPLATPTVAVNGQVNNDTALTPTAVLTPVRVSADTTGVIALAIVIVVTVLVIAILGQKRPRKTS
jgi:hypothetical protein